jgi:hypothetical protein
VKTKSFRRLVSSFFSLSLVLCCFSSNAEQTLQPFTSDGCSVFPDGTWQQQQLWLPCCVAHDLAYWQGGSSQARAAADAQLKQCVSAVGEPEIAAIMLTGVRVGGSPYLPTAFRWGYGWTEFRGYQALSVAELTAVATSLASHQFAISALAYQLPLTSQPQLPMPKPANQSIVVP